MKKEYQKPEMQAITIYSEQTILSASTDTEVMGALGAEAEFD